MRKLIEFFKKQKPVDKTNKQYQTILLMAATAPDGQASKECVDLINSFLTTNPTEQQCYDKLDEISKRHDISPFVKKLCDVSSFYARPV